MRKILCFISLIITTTLYAQNIVVTKVGDFIKTSNFDISENYVFYQEEGSNLYNKIDKNLIVMIKKNDGSVVSFVSDSNDSKTTIVIEKHDSLALCGFKGFLLAKGNNVCVLTDSKRDFEQSGQEAFKAMFIRDGFWQVVKYPDQAHFCIQYYVDLSGRDKAKFRIINRITGKSVDCTDLTSWFGVPHTSEEPSDNILAAKKLYSYFFPGRLYSKKKEDVPAEFTDYGLYDAIVKEKKYVKKELSMFYLK